MTIIEKGIKLVGSKGEHELVGLLDSGATYSCIDQDLAKECGTSWRRWTEPAKRHGRHENDH